MAQAYYLLAAGIILVIVGYLAGGLSAPKGPPVIHHRMRDEDIANQLNRQDSLSVPELIGFLGYLLVFISIVWRIVLVFV
jgi:hypothetical protein